MDWPGLLLAFNLLECLDLREFCVFFFNFLFKSWTCCFKASTVSRFFSSAVWSVEDMLFFTSMILGSRAVFDRLWWLRLSMLISDLRPNYQPSESFFRRWPLRPSFVIVGRELGLRILHRILSISWIHSDLFYLIIHPFWKFLSLKNTSSKTALIFSGPSFIL